MEPVLYKIQDLIRQIDTLNNNCNENMKRLNTMMLELKGIVAIVRPQVKKTGWYGEEIEANEVKVIKETLEIEQIESKKNV